MIRLAASPRIAVMLALLCIPIAHGVVSADPLVGPDYDAGRPSIDHLVPIRRVVEMPGFNELDRTTQESILDSRENLVMTPLGENLSRKDLTYAEYEGRADGRGMSGRGSMLLMMMEPDFDKFGISVAEDGKLFTYEAKGATGDREEDRRAAG